jgi:hypothetical protein
VILQDHQPERIEKWNEVWTAFKKDSPEVRQTLETEFRAALGRLSTRPKIHVRSEPAIALGEYEGRQDGTQKSWWSRMFTQAGPSPCRSGHSIAS